MIKYDFPCVHLEKNYALIIFNKNFTVFYSWIYLRTLFVGKITILSSFKVNIYYIFSAVRSSADLNWNTYSVSWTHNHTQHKLKLKVCRSGDHLTWSLCLLYNHKERTNTESESISTPSMRRTWERMFYPCMSYFESWFDLVMLN